MSTEPVPGTTGGEVRPPGTEIVPFVPQIAPALPAVRALDLYSALMTDSRCENTRVARAYDIEVFRRFLGAPDASAACATLVGGGRGYASALALAFRTSQAERGLKPSTVNRTLCALRRVILLARRFGLVDWVAEIDDLPNNHVPDRRGPGPDGWRDLWAAAVAAGDSPIARRNRAILRLLHDSALRKSEAIALDVGDADLQRPGVAVTAKGHAGTKSWVTINDPTAQALRDWLEARGTSPGPLFVAAMPGLMNRRAAAAAAPPVPLPPRAAALRAAGLDGLAIAMQLAREDYRRPDGRVFTVADVERVTPKPGTPLTCRRLNGRGIGRWINDLARTAGLSSPVRPHGLRHAGITRALDLTNGDIRKVAKFARHRDPKVTMLYDDSRQDMAGVVARMLGDDA